MESFDIVQILGYGLSGFAFLLIFMAYSLILKEQRKAKPSREILSTIRMFMGLVFLSVVVVGIFSIPTLRRNQVLQKKNDTLLLQNYTVRAVDEIRERTEIFLEANRNPTKEETVDFLENNIRTLDTLSETVNRYKPEKSPAIDQLKKDLERDVRDIKKSNPTSTRRDEKKLRREVERFQKTLDKTIKTEELITVQPPPQEKSP